MRDDRDVSALFAAVDAYLRGRRRPWSAYPATFCARCGRRIVAGDGQIDLALLYPARRCAACYDHESHGGVDDKPDGHGGMAALMQCDVGGAVCYAPRKRVNYQFTNWCARHRIWCQRLVLSYLVVYTERGNTCYASARTTRPTGEPRELVAGADIVRNGSKPKGLGVGQARVPDGDASAEGYR